MTGIYPQQAALAAMIDPTPAAPGEGGLDHEELFPIREVSRLTGINPVTLRAWERRYGLIQPTRTESGHRLYSHADVDEVRQILGWIERGVAVSKVGKILARTRAADAEPAEVADPPGTSEHQTWRNRVRQSAQAFDEAQLERVYGQIFASYPLTTVYQDILMPVWEELRIAHDSFGRTSEWLFLDMFLRGRAWQRLLLARDQQEIRVVVAALPEQARVLELLVCALLLGSSEVQVSVLAPGQPLEELSLVCERMAPDALVLFSNHAPAADLPRRLARLALALDCPLLFAGDASELVQDSLVGSQIVCLGGEGRLMRRRLQQSLDGHLDS